MQTNTDITIVRITEDGTVSNQIIRGVNWQGERKTSVTDKGLQSADMITVFIPCSSVLPDVDIRKADFVVDGIKDYGEASGKELRRLVESDSGVSVISIQDNRKLGKNLGHIELGCA
ncbi:DUF6751 family protein [Eubacterium maltosivorans]|uniref:Uncharacterized protein n=1 Tax=Eubacterium maltosivorans TaxID=2041044 RepID=A0A4P9C877_EUBML|nr:DUF6751 family protein [Eubacterium maltosivorans]QCT70832.1 hypothetical protein CPZ25_005645 [Eubacterium maltosivorans]